MNIANNSSECTEIIADFLKTVLSDELWIYVYVPEIIA